MPSKARQAILVLGMHRSGTSAFTGALGFLGARLPANPLPPHPDNPKGYFESRKIVSIHDRLLGAVGSNWFGLERIPGEWFGSAPAASFTEELVAAVHEDFGNAAMFVVKDPRLCRLLPIWRGVLAQLDAHALHVLVIRNPLEAARSLEQRDNIAIGYGCLLWLRHVLEAERETRGTPRVFEQYGNLLREPVHTTERVIGQISLSKPTGNQAKTNINTFVDPSMRHHLVDVKELHSSGAFFPWLSEAYEALIELTRNPNNEAAQQRLDGVRALFDPAVASFAPLLAIGNKALVDLRSERAETIARLEDKAKETADKIAQLESTRKSYQDEVAILRRGAVAATDKIAQLENARKSDQIELANLRQAAAALNSKVQSLGSTLSQLYASSSWRITKPLRIARQLLDRVGK